MAFTRRGMVALIGGTLVPLRATAETGAPIGHDFVFARPDGSLLELKAYAGRPLLVVNTATACAYAPQFGGLQQLWLRFGGRGLLVLGVPSNDFGGQEPLPDADLAAAAERQHGVTFPLSAKTSVRGLQAHPFYRWAAARRPGETPAWNFHKYLVSRTGELAAAFSSATPPTDPRIVAAIGEELAG
jgi:glutathione peroxidase